MIQKANRIFSSNETAYSKITAYSQVKVMADFVERICNHGLETIEAWRNTAQKCWEKACEFEGLSVDTKIVAFSKDNPYIVFYERAYQNYRESKRDFAACGYVGLRMDTRSIPKIKNKSLR